MKHLVSGISSLALLFGALPSIALAERQDAEAPIQYECANGMILAVSYLAVRGHSAIEIEFPNGREAGVMAKRLLPETQSGSGVRYASDITELHVKGDTARFATAASAKSEAIASVECMRSGAAEEPGPITQAAKAGKYFIDSGHTAAYFEAEAICFGPDARGFLGINRAEGENRAVTYNGRDAKQAEVGPVDAGMGQRRYQLTLIDNQDQQATLHFISPGMREPDQPSATAGLMSISQNGDKVDCVDNDRIVYVGNGNNLGLSIAAEEDGLALSIFGQYADPVWQDMKRGYVSIDEDETVFHFFDGASYTRVEASHHGVSDFAEDGRILSKNWNIHTPSAQRYQWPEAYFVADTGVLAAYAPTLSVETSNLLKNLSICNHLAGEASENAERNAQIMSRWDAINCDGVPDAYDKAISDMDKESSIRPYLESNSPVWI